MSSKVTVDISKGIGLVGLLFTVLLVLKLTNLAPALTWFWVFFPLLLGPAIILAIMVGFSLVLSVLHIMDLVARWRRKRQRERSRRN